MRTRIKNITKQIALIVIINFLLYTLASCSSSDSDVLPPDNGDNTEIVTYKETVFLIVGYKTVNQEVTEPIYEVVQAEFDSETNDFIRVVYIVMTNQDLLDSYLDIWGNRNDFFCPNTSMFINFNRIECEMPLLINPDLDEATQLEIHLNEQIFNYEHNWLSTIVGDNFNREQSIGCIIELN